MTRELSILMVFLLSLIQGTFSQEISKDEKLRMIITEHGQADITVPFTERKEADYLIRHLSVYSLKEKQLYITISPGDLDWFLDQDIEYQIIEAKGAQGLVTAADVNQAMEWESYPAYSQYDSIMRCFASQYPSLCRLDTIGFSINNKLVLAVKISDNVTIKENEPEVFYSSTMHGDETGGFVLMLRLIDYLLKNYNSDTRVTNLVDQLQIWINPLANPDGTYRTGNTISSPIRNNASGFNLNRSFPDPLDPAIVVPKENVDMIKFMRNHKFVISANFHSGAEVVNYPWDRYLSKYHADNGWFYDISRAYADTVHNYSTAAYMNFLDNGVTRGAAWYLVIGGRQDFVSSELQGREVTIELDDIKITPASQLGLLWLYNRNSMLGYLENALFGIYGTVRDSITLEPVEARIFISGHDRDSSHVYSDTTYGSFVRMLSPGQYNLTFSAKGYKDKIISSINVQAGVRTNITVNMESDLSNVEAYLNQQPRLYPVPASDRLNAILPGEFNGVINVTLYDLLGKVVRNFDTGCMAGIAFEIDVSGLPAGNYIVVFRDKDTGNRAAGRIVIVK